MSLLKKVFFEYNFTPSPISSNSFNQFIRINFFVVFFLTLTGCNPVALVNPDSYGDKWDNTYLWFDPEDMTTIYISDSGDPATAEAIPNDSDFLIEWDKKDKTYHLKVTSYYQEIDFAWFGGYDAKNSSEEIPWVQNGNTIELESEKLLEPGNEGMYHISLSDDLKD